jgi:CheY-like chemotaxis protein
MQVMDGYELNSQLKRHKDWSAIPLIVLTAAKPRAGALVDVEVVLQGPPNLEELLEHVRAACQKAASARAAPRRAGSTH